MPFVERRSVVGRMPARLQRQRTLVHLIRKRAARHHRLADRALVCPDHLRSGVSLILAAAWICTEVSSLLLDPELAHRAVPKGCDPGFDAYRGLAAQGALTPASGENRLTRVARATQRPLGPATDRHRVPMCVDRCSRY